MTTVPPEPVRCADPWCSKPRGHRGFCDQRLRFPERPRGATPANNTDHPLLVARERARGRTLSGRLTGEERRAAALVVYPEEVARPRTWGDCAGEPRPCPWVSCRYHLYLDVTPNGSLRIHHPGLEVDELPETCALDVAARGGATLDQVGGMFNLVRERVRQIETAALRHAREAAEEAGVAA